MKQKLCSARSGAVHFLGLGFMIYGCSIKVYASGFVPKKQPGQVRQIVSIQEGAEAWAECRGLNNPL